jgi:hypothetical protein
MTPAGFPLVIMTISFAAGPLGALAGVGGPASETVRDLRPFPKRRVLGSSALTAASGTRWAKVQSRLRSRAGISRREMSIAGNSDPSSAAAR